MFKFLIITNDFSFLIQFAHETGAYIEVVEFPDSFLLCYEDEFQRDSSHELLNTYILSYQEEDIYGS